MNRSFILPAVLLFCVTASAQTALIEGAELLFRKNQCKLTTAEKNSIFQKTGWQLSNDKRQFITDKKSADFPFDAFVYPTDLNKDKQEEIFIVFGNTYTSGGTGSSVLLFIKNASGQYQPHLGFSGTIPAALPASNGKYPDLLIGGPGFDIPVWRWNGKGYSFYKKIKEQDYEKLKPLSIEDISKAYTAALRQ